MSDHPEELCNCRVPDAPVGCPVHRWHPPMTDEQHATIEERDRRLNLGRGQFHENHLEDCE